MNYGDAHHPKSWLIELWLIELQSVPVKFNNQIITHYLLPITYYLLPITYYPLPITYYLLPITQSPNQTCSEIINDFRKPLASGKYILPYFDTTKA